MPEVDQERWVGSVESPPATPWYETTAAIVVAGVGGLVAIGVLVFAILTTSHHSVLPTQPERLTPVTPTKSMPSRSATATTSTRSPVSTSEGIGTPSAPPPEVPVETTAPPTTTMSNPYATTSVPNGAAF
ncbi:hypothetical protein [Mycobacterium sp. NPDC004974]